ncbi:MAG TPA: [Fe-Fe] hydrogenase large subunit C-terminal domain-containing protein [Myxococcota bacterium]|nr:[Fe-Fe] hydrogenase large subunit C-terminal domain-containing protein [Myxococcota bacterium]
MISPLVFTIRERCRVCYTCVRECPAKAIRIIGGQAEVISERCIGCGNCVQVCSQKAKQVVDNTDEVKELLKSGQKVAAILAPSFPAEFPGITHRRLLGMLDKLGFSKITEVGFGADLVADRYRQLLDSNKDERHIATTCPTVVGYVERYAPHLVKSLAPIVSPMVATARVVKEIYGPELAVVFIGPCVAKKQERAEYGEDDIDVVLTFPELRVMLKEAGIRTDSIIAEREFDPPFARIGGLFPVTGGLLRTADIDDDPITGDAVVVDGRATFVEAIREFDAGAINSPLLEVLACTGCIMGPAVTNQAPLFSRRRQITDYVKRRIDSFDEDQWRSDMERFDDLDLSKQFKAYDKRLPRPTTDELDAILNKMGKHSPDDELNCGACGYDTCIEHAIAIHQGLAESEMCLPWTIDRLRDTVEALNASHRDLAEAQDALIQAEKLASMGQLAAGIAHEVNNPLGVVLMYAHILAEETGPEGEYSQELELIAEQASRCKNIVSGLLNFARQNQVNLQPVDMIDLFEHALNSVRRPAEITVDIQIDEGTKTAELDLDQMVQVLTNLIANAYEAMANGGTLTLRAFTENDRAFIKVSDTGVGIPQENISRIFTPFFTTKPMGKGTGLGLAVTYGIIKMHHGDIRVESNNDPNAGPTGSTFTISVPLQGRAD